MLSIITESTPLFLTGVFFFGLLIGSFLNVVILRLPARLYHDWRCQCRDLLEIEADESAPAPPDIIRGRSHCPKCGYGIQAHENIPVVSYLFLRGKCSSCGTKISLRYPLIELSTAILFLATAWHFGPSQQGNGRHSPDRVSDSLTGIDTDHQLLPDNLTLPLLWVGLLLSLFDVFIDPVTSIIGAILGYMVFVGHLFSCSDCLPVRKEWDMATSSWLLHWAHGWVGKCCP